MKRFLCFFKELKNKENLINITTLIVLVFIDQFTKKISIGTDIEIIPNVLNFTYVENTGVAFGFFEKNNFLVINILFILLILIYWKIINPTNINSAAFVFIISGSLGNLINRIFNGYVIDFINIKMFNFPIFNLADFFIVFGFVWFFITKIKKEIFVDK